MTPRATAALALVLLAFVLAPHGCHGGFFDLLGRKKNETANPAPPKENELKPTIEVSAYPPGVPVPDSIGSRRRGGSARRGGAFSTPSTDVAPGTPSPSLAAPAGTSDTQAQVVLKSGQEPSKTPEQTVLTQFVTKKDNNNIVATVDVPGPPPIITGGSPITINRVGDAPPDQTYQVDGALPVGPEGYSPFVADPSNPRVVYGPYPSELGFKPFGFLPPFRNQPDYGFSNVMEMGPHPWWHPYGRRRRTWYDFPPRHPWAPEPIQYMPMTPVWARPRIVRDLYPLETEIFEEEDPRDNEPQSYFPHPYYNPYPYSLNYHYGSMYPYSGFHQSYTYGYPWVQPYAPPPPYPPLLPYTPQQETSPTQHALSSDQNTQDETPSQGEAPAPKHRMRHHKHRQVAPSMWNQPVPHVQQPWSRPPQHHYAGHQSLHHPSAGAPPPAIQVPVSFQSPSNQQEPPPPPPPPPAPSGGDEAYERVA